MRPRFEQRARSLRPPQVFLCLHLWSSVASARSEWQAPHQDDASSLIQREAYAHRSGSLLHGRLGLLASEQRRFPLFFDCKKYPAWCGAPFNCSKAPLGGGALRLMRHPATWDGHSNLNSWCDSPQYYPYMKECIVNHDLVKAAQIQYDWSVAQNKDTDEFDASYCFLEGHCTNENVTLNTTLEEAEQMCDERYGHKGWAHWSPVVDEERATKKVINRLLDVAQSHNGFNDPEVTAVFVKMACAMGNFHCDVVYCRETYCKKDYYVRKYSHLARKREAKLHPHSKHKHHHHH